MIGTDIAKTLLSGAVGALSVAGQVAGHAAWWVRYQVDGTAHDDDPPPAGRSD